MKTHAKIYNKSGVRPRTHTTTNEKVWQGIKIAMHVHCSQHSKVYSRKFFAKNILLEEEIDIEAA